MNKVYRRGIDLNVAFATGLKRLAYKNIYPQAAPSYESMTSLSVTEHSSSIASSQRQSAIRHFTRKIASICYHLSKPLLRPIVSRVRRYMLTNFVQDMQQEMQSVKASLHELIGQLNDSRIRQDEIQRSTQVMFEDFKIYQAELNKSAVQEGRTQDMKLLGILEGLESLGVNRNKIQNFKETQFQETQLIREELHSLVLLQQQAQNTSLKLQETSNQLTISGQASI